jgi:hypothetical protein
MNKAYITDDQLLELAKVGVIALVDEATGYQKERNPSELMDEYKKSSRKEGKK